jgi:hypothetical protein
MMARLAWVLAVAAAAAVALFSCQVIFPVNVDDAVSDAGMDAGRDVRDVKADSVREADRNFGAETQPGEAAPPVMCGHIPPFSDISTTPGGAAGNTISLVLKQPQAAGDYLVVGVNSVSCGTVEGINDSNNNPYGPLIPSNAIDEAGALETWGTFVMTGADASTNTITVRFFGSCSNRNVKVVEYAGIDGVEDSSVSQHGSGGAPDASLVTTLPHDILFAHTADSKAAKDPGAGWAELLTDKYYTIAEDRDAGLPGSYAVTFQPGPGDAWVIEGIALHCK